METSSSTQQCSVEGGFPFVFYAADGVTHVDGVANEETGLCTFPEANCRSDLPVPSCCNATAEAERTGSRYMFVAFAVVFIPRMYFARRRSHLPPAKRREAAAREKQRQMIPSWVPGGRPTRLFSLGLMAWIVAQVIVPIYMRTSIQFSLPVSDRNALIAAEAFLVPFQAIFQFIEDIVLVRVNYALGAGERAVTNRLVHVGLLSSAAMGILAAGIATALALLPTTLNALTNPGGENDARLYPGCDLVPTDDEVRDKILPYWLITVWSFVGQYTGLVMSGFLLGAWQFYVVGWIGAVSVAFTPIVWFASTTKDLWLLGVAQSATCWAFPIMTISYLTSPLGHELGEKTGVQLKPAAFWSSLFVAPEERIQTERETQKKAKNFFVDDESSDASAFWEHGDLSDRLLSRPSTNYASFGSMDSLQEPLLTEQEPSTAQLLLEGFKIMVLDIGIQFASTLGVYLALMTDSAAGYEIASMQSAIPAYGAAYALGLGLVMKVIGSQMIAANKLRDFAVFARISVACAFLLVPIIVGCVVPFHSGLAFAYGGNACAYAKDEKCVEFFTRVFGPNGEGGVYTLPFTFYSFAAVSSVDSVFFVLRGALLACLDLDFMVLTTLFGLLAYVPAIIVSMTVFSGHAMAIFVSMYVPQALLCIAFFSRLEQNIQKMLRDESHLMPIRRRSTVSRGSTGSEALYVSA